MKKHIILGLAALTALFTSCDSELDQSPAQSIDQDLALNNDSNVKRVLIGAYDELSNYALYGGNLQLYSELAASNREIGWDGTFTQPREIFNKQILINNTYVANTWAAAYRVINVANNILEAIEVVNEEDQERITGEALFLRGSMYFELARYYGLPYSAGNVETNLAVPLVLTPTRGISEENLVSRNTVEDVYSQVLSDLTQAEDLLPPTNGFFASKYVASAMLSRVYLQMGRYADARDAANDAIDIATENGKDLTGNYADAFNNESDSMEDLFSIQVSSQDGDNYMHLFYSVPEFGGRDGDIVPTQAHLDLYETGDDRLNLYYISADEVRIGKWRDQYRNVKVIRLAEMYLTRAECNFREGTSVGDTPLNDINRIRDRVDLPFKLLLTLDEILLERKLELAHEGHILHDIKRTQGSILDNTNSTVYEFDDNRLVFPIPQREREANTNLTQNAGYGED